MRKGIFVLGLAVIIAAGAPAAHAQTVVGQAICVGPSGTVTVSLTGYLLDLQRKSDDDDDHHPKDSDDKAFSEAEVEMAGSNFAPLASLLTSRTEFSGCELIASNADGLVLQFKRVKIVDVKLLGGSSRNGQEAKANPAPVVRVVLDYASVTIQSSSSSGGPVGVISDGSSLSNGWNRVSNQNP